MGDQRPSPRSPSPREGLLDVLDRSRALGFLGPGPVERHLDHAQAMADVVGEAAGVCIDLGAGGGVPGLVLAGAWPDTRWCLLDASERRVAFLEGAVRRLGLADRVRVVHGRAEEVVGRELGREAADLVVARGFGPPPVTAECASPLLAVGGRLVVSEPPGPFSPDRWPAQPLAARLGLRATPVAVRGYAWVVLDKVARCDPGLPRRVGLARRRPLY